LNIREHQYGFRLKPFLFPVLINLLHLPSSSALNLSFNFYTYDLYSLSPIISKARNPVAYATSTEWSIVGVSTRATNVSVVAVFADTKAELPTVAMAKGRSYGGM